jgi:hypothetical protein
MDLESLFGLGRSCISARRVIAIMPSANHPALLRRLRTWKWSVSLAGAQNRDHQRLMASRARPPGGGWPQSVWADRVAGATIVTCPTL